jgi:hypothetical protein
LKDNRVANLSCLDLPLVDKLRTPSKMPVLPPPTKSELSSYIKRRQNSELKAIGTPVKNLMTKTPYSTTHHQGHTKPKKFA